MRKRALQLLVSLSSAAVFLLGIVVVGKWAQDYLRHDERYTLAFTTIDCAPPPDQGKSDFLTEVQYLASLPATLSLLDDDLAERLTEGFARHPWVEKVEEVRLTRPRQVEVRLRYRTPVLAVSVVGELRVVDAHGILLPGTANAKGLPVFSGTAPPPVGPAGTRWGDMAVEAAARAASP